MAQIRGRLSVGTELMGIAAFDFGFAAPTLDGGSDGGLVDYAGSLGLGYRVRLETDLEAEPYLLARISYREVTGHEQTLSRLGLGFEAGIALRYFLESKTGVYLDAGYIVDAPGPRPAAPFNETPMIAHEVFKIVGGLTLGF